MRERTTGSERAAAALADVGHDLRDPARLERALGRIERGQRRRRALRAAAVGAAVVLGALAVLGGLRGMARQEDEGLQLSDGSRVRPVGGHIEVREVSERRVEVAVLAGRAEVEVAPRPERVFRVVSGAIVVEVLGTAFAVERLGVERARVVVRRGRVRVLWDGGDAELGAGESGEYPPSEPALSEQAPEPSGPAIGRPPTVDEVAPQPREIEPEARPVELAVARTPRRADAIDDWRELAEDGHYGAAFDLLDQGEVEPGDAIDDLLLAADAARLSGHSVEALPFLERAFREHADDPRAVIAAFTAGRILLQLDRAAEAARTLDTVLELEPSGSLAEDALARAIEAHGRSGHRERARALAQRYLERHPEGRWAARVRRTLEQAHEEEPLVEGSRGDE